MIVVAGKNNIAVHAIEVLSKKFDKNNIVAIPNQGDIGHDTWQRSFRKAANKLGVKIRTLNDIKDAKNIECFLSLECDQLIDPNRYPSDKIFNIHFSDLPKYKGMYTSFWPIYNGEKNSGVTLHRIDRGIDTGAIIAKEKFSISSNDRSMDMYIKYIASGIKLFDENINNLLAGNFSTTAQRSVKSTYYSKNSVDFSNLKINLYVTAWQLKRQVYAYTFRPYQLPVIHGRSVAEVKITSQRSLVKPGQLIRAGENFIVMSTIDFDVIIYFDGLELLLSKIPLINSSDFSKGLNHIAGVNDRNKIGWSPIIVAAYNGRLELVRDLISLGANVNDTNFKGTSVLMYAKDYFLRSKDNALFNLLLEFGADINKKDYSGKKLVDYLSPEDLTHFRGYL